MSESRIVIDRLMTALAARNDSDLARKLGTRPSTIGSWRARDTVPYAECVNLARRENISLDWLLDGVGSPRRDAGTQDRYAAPANGSAAGQATVPFYTPPASSAAGMAVQEEVAPDGGTAATACRTFRFPETWLHQVIGVAPGHARVLVAEGSALRPEAGHGDLLILDTDLEQQRPDGLYLLLVDGRMQVRHLYFLPGRLVRVTGGAPADQDYEVSLARTTPADFEIVARVALHGRVL